MVSENASVLMEIYILLDPFFHPTVSHFLTHSGIVQLFNLLVCLYTGSFHLIHLMFDDYVLYLLESLHCQERANDLMRAMKGEGSTGETAAWRSNP